MRGSKGLFASVVLAVVLAASTAAYPLDNLGTAVAWGENSSSQLGDGTKTCRHSPVIVREIGPVRAVAAGKRHSLAIAEDHTVFAWGANDLGQLGTGSANDKAKLPRQVPGLTGVTAIAAGDDFSLALDSDGRVFAWGRNDQGQLGNGATGGFSRVPVEVLKPDGVQWIVEIAAGGRHALARTYDAAILAWGDNREGQLGTTQVGSNSSRPVPVDPRPFAPGRIDAGDSHSIAVSRIVPPVLYAWGGNTSGQLGDGTKVNRATPAPVPGLWSVADVGAGGRHNVALTNDGSVWTWGDNTYGQLGDGTREDRAVVAPVLLAGSPFAPFLRVIAGGDVSMAETRNGFLGWGKNTCGQLGTGEAKPEAQTTPSSAMSGDHPIAVDLGGDHGLGIR